MRRLAMMAAAAAFIGGGSVASAADLSFKDAAPAASAPAIWTGFYVGGHAGALWSKGDSALAEYTGCFGFGCSPSSETGAERDGGAVLAGGIHLGYNWQNDAIVYGIEADAGFADGVNYLGSLRGRLGYAHGNLLVYATAGIAFAGFKDEAFTFRYFDTYSSYKANDNDRKIAAVVGGGVEYKVSQNWSIGAEGLYYAFGEDTERYSIDDSCGIRCTVHYDVTTKQDNDLWTARARLTYHFDGEEGDAPLK